jgi:hypothetical protein
VSHHGFDYSQFLTAFKLYAFETITSIIVIVLLIDFAIKELRPALRRIRDFFHAP